MAPTPFVMLACLGISLEDRPLSFVGPLHDLAFPDLLQALAASHESGRLTLSCRQGAP